MNSEVSELLTELPLILPSTHATQKLASLEQQDLARVTAGHLGPLDSCMEKPAAV